MSKQAEKILEKNLGENPDGIEWNRAVEIVMNACEVKSNTAETYIRRASTATSELTADGTKIVVDPADAGETILHDEENQLELEAGEATDNKYFELTILKDNGHPQIPREHEDGYFRRRLGREESNSGLSTKTDVHAVTATIEDPDFSTLLKGKHGVGKDKLILHICAKTNRPVIRLVANDDPDFVDLLVGTYAPDENGDFSRKKGLLQIAMENGYTFIMDEFNALSGKVQTMLNKILEDADQNKLVIPESNEVIEPHPEFKFVGTMNPNEIGYADREDLDQATASRFIPIEIPRLDEESERRVVAANTEWEKNDRELNILLDESGGVVQGLRALHDQGKVSTWVSTRDVIQIGRMAESLGDARSASEMILVGRANPEDKEPIRAALNDSNWP